MAYNPYRASYGLPPPILPSAGKPVPQGMAPIAPPLPSLQAALRIQNPEPNMSRQNTNLNTSLSSIRSSNRSAVSILSENFRLEDQLTNGFATNKQQREAMKAFDPQRIRELKGSRRAQQMVSSALAAAGGTSPAVPESSPPARTVSSNPPSKNGSTDSLFGGLSPIAKVENKRKRKTRKRKQSRKSQKQLKNRKHK
jgi:hypothetical protein